MAAMSAADRVPALPGGSERNDFHPLEVIPFFRRWKCSPLRDVLYTFIWNSLLGAIFWSLGGIFRPSSMTLHNFITSVLIANAIGYTLHAMFIVTARLGVDGWVRKQGPLVTTSYYTVISTFGVVVGFTVVALAYDTEALQWILRPRWLAAMGVSSLLISTILAAIFFARERHARAEATLALER